MNGYEEGDDARADQIVKERIFVTLIGDVLTDVVYKAYTSRYFVVASQPSGTAGAGRITINQLPTADCPAEGDFSFSIIRDCEGFRNAAKIIALGLGVDKPLDLYLSFTNYQNEIINNFVQLLLGHL